MDVKEMNKDKTHHRQEQPNFEEQNYKLPHFFPSQNSFENSVMTGLISGQSMPYLKNSESEIRTRFFGSDWECKSKSEPKIYEDFGF